VSVAVADFDLTPENVTLDRMVVAEFQYALFVWRLIRDGSVLPTRTLLFCFSQAAGEIDIVPTTAVSSEKSKIPSK
jgi:hypothetical protein